MLQHLTQYSRFESVDEMDKHVQQHIKAHRLTKAQLAVLYCIAGHALATPGAAHLKADTIARKCTISTKTVYRAVNYLQQVGIIEKIACTKLNGIKAANIYAICKYVPTKMSARVQSKERWQLKPKVAKYERESVSFQAKLCSTNNIKRTQWHEKLAQHFQFFPVPDHLHAPLMTAISQLELTCSAHFERAKYVITQSIYLLATNEITLYSTFEKFIVGAYKKWRIHESQPVQKPAVSTRPVPFYNWLDERAIN